MSKAKATEKRLYEDDLREELVGLAAEMHKHLGRDETISELRQAIRLLLGDDPETISLLRRAASLLYRLMIDNKKPSDDDVELLQRVVAHLQGLADG